MANGTNDETSLLSGSIRFNHGCALLFRLGLALILFDGVQKRNWTSATCPGPCAHRRGGVLCLGGSWITGKPEVEQESCQAGQKAACARLGTINALVITNLAISRVVGFPEKIGKA